MQKFYIFITLIAIALTTHAQTSSPKTSFFTLKAPSYDSYHISRNKMHSFNPQVFYIFDKQENLLSHKMLTTPQYIFYPTAFLPQNIQLFTGHLGFQAGLSWLYTIQPLDILSLYPLFAQIGLRWEATYIPFITPFIQVSKLYVDPFKQGEKKLISPHTFTELYAFSLGSLLSFNLLNPYFSLRMQQEYNITDIGLFLEYQIYSFKFDWEQANRLNEGFSFGFYISM